MHVIELILGVCGLINNLGGGYGDELLTKEYAAANSLAYRHAAGMSLAPIKYA